MYQICWYAQLSLASELIDNERGYQS